MPASRTELILQAIVAALGAAGKPTGVSVDRSRAQPVELAELPRISVYPRDEEVNRATQSRTVQLSDRKLRVAVTARVAGNDAALDPLRQWIVQSVLADLSLGGLALAIDELALNWELDGDSQTDYAVVETTFEIRYTSRKNDLARAA